jgi:hypothetical protein
MMGVESEMAGLKADPARIDNKLEAFRESVDDRFDHTGEALKSSFRTLQIEIQSLKRS